MTATEHERRFALFGTSVRLLIGPPIRPDLRAPAVAAIEIEALMRRMHAALTRFDPRSELSLLNSDPRSVCHVSALLAVAIRAALWALETSGGLVDPTLLPELERAGYSRSLVDAPSARLAEALTSAPARRRASARDLPAAITVDSNGQTVERPPGVALDLGGTAKGLAADLAASRLAGYATYAIDVGGDIRIGGESPESRIVDVEHPFPRRRLQAFGVASGAVATSGLATRIWRTPEGFAHHLLDPSTGEAAWTGVVQATAIAETAVEAETLAKAALLSGPERGAEILAPQGGVLVLDSGVVRAPGLSLASTSAESQAFEIAA